MGIRCLDNYSSFCALSLVSGSELGAGVSGNGQRHHGKPESCLRKHNSIFIISTGVQDVPENNFCNQAGVLAKRFFSGTPCIFILYVSDVIPGGFRQKLIMSFILDQVTAVFPYIILIIFFVRAMGLRGMEDGVRHLFTPKVTFS